MNKAMKILIVAALVTVVAVIIGLKEINKQVIPATTEMQGAQATIEHNMPRLVDLGAGKCIPCKMMAPVLEEIKEEYKGKLEVVFIDVWENPDQSEQYNIKMIPTQIFYDAAGKEIFRHEGFYSKEDILGKYKELGIDLQK